MYVIELALKFCPFPLSVQRKEVSDASALYQKVLQSMDKGNPHLLELTCEKVADKKVAVLVEEVLAVQMYEKTAGSGSARRPGFAFEG